MNAKWLYVMALLSHGILVGSDGMRTFLKIGWWWVVPGSLFVLIALALALARFAVRKYRLGYQRGLRRGEKMRLGVPVAIEDLPKHLVLCRVGDPIFLSHGEAIIIAEVMKGSLADDFRVGMVLACRGDFPEAFTRFHPSLTQVQKIA